MKYIKTSNNNLADVLCRIRNGYLAEKRIISVTKTVFVKNILKKLKDLGFILDIQEGVINEYKVYLRYTENFIPALRYIKTFKNKYISLDFLKKKVPVNGFGNYLISTNKGVLSNFEALKEKVGGQLICEVF